METNWTPLKKEMSEAWWNYWNYQGTPDRDKIQNWWFEKIDALEKELEQANDAINNR